MNYCRATFEIITRIRQMAPLLYIINFSKLRFPFKNETNLICAKNCLDLSSISEVRSYITKWPCFLANPIYIYIYNYICSTYEIKAVRCAKLWIGLLLDHTGHSQKLSLMQ